MYLIQDRRSGEVRGWIDFHPDAKMPPGNPGLLKVILCDRAGEPISDGTYLNYAVFLRRGLRSCFVITWVRGTDCIADQFLRVVQGASKQEKPERFVQRSIAALNGDGFTSPVKFPDGSSVSIARNDAGEWAFTVSKPSKGVPIPRCLERVS